MYHPIHTFIRWCHMFTVRHDYHANSCECWRLLEYSWASLNYALRIVTKSLCSCLHMFNTIIELHVINENNLFVGKWKWILIVIKVYMYVYIYIVETFTTLSENLCGSKTQYHGIFDISSFILNLIELWQKSID